MDDTPRRSCRCGRTILRRLSGSSDFTTNQPGTRSTWFFEHLSFRLGTREFVVYNPRDEQVMTSHNMDLLQRTGELGLRRGYYAVHDTPHPHWKYFLFD